MERKQDLDLVGTNKFSLSQTGFGSVISPCSILGTQNNRITLSQVNLPSF